MGVEIKFQGKWHKIVAMRPEVKLPCNEATLPPYWELDNGIQIHSLNPQIEDKKKCDGFPIKFREKLYVLQNDLIYTINGWNYKPLGHINYER